VANYPYVYSVTRFKDFLSQIKRVRDPKIVDYDWLEKLTFEQRNDRAFYRVLQYIEFISEDNETSDLWRSYRVDGELSGSMATAIVLGYSELFEMYEEAWSCTDDELKSVFKQAGASDRVAEMSLSTFRALCSLADFSAAKENGATTGENGNTTASPVQPLVAQPPEFDSPAPALHIDFQVHIAADAPPEQIDKIFESMAKHLYGKMAE